MICRDCRIEADTRIKALANPDWTEHTVKAILRAASTKGHAGCNGCGCQHKPVGSWSRGADAARD